MVPNLFNYFDFIEIWNHLNAGGYLVLGAAESLFGLSQDFDQLVHGTAVFYRKKS